MMHVISQHLPLELRMISWQLLYCVNRDGYSHHTFFDKTKDYDCSVLLVRDSLGHVFGAYLTTAIKNISKYSGDGSSFVFSFHDGEELDLYMSTGANHNFQLTDDDFMIIGGASNVTTGSRGAIIISDCFTRGYSSACDTYGN